jgi:hypothetical protein
VIEFGIGLGAPSAEPMDDRHEIGRDLATIRLSAAGEAYFPTDPADFPEPTAAAIIAAQDPSGSYAEEVEWVMGPHAG